MRPVRGGLLLNLICRADTPPPLVLISERWGQPPDHGKLFAIEDVAVAQSMSVMRLRGRRAVMAVTDIITRIPEGYGPSVPIGSVVRA